MMTIKNILVATDFSEFSEAALTYGRELATRFDATLHVLHVTPDIYLPLYGLDGYVAPPQNFQQDIENEARQRLHQLLIDSDKSGPPTVPAVITAKSPASSIVDYAEEHGIDLVVMGTHGRSGLTHFFMGSVAERVVRLAPCPVLTVRHPERDFIVPDTLASVAHA